MPLFGKSEAEPAPELPDLEAERILRTYTQLHSSRYYLGYVALGGIFGSLMVLKSTLMLLRVLTYERGSVEFEFLELALVIGLFFEVGFVVKLAQIDSFNFSQNKTLAQDAGLALTALILFIADNAIEQRTVNCLLELFWLAPYVIRAWFRGQESKALVQGEEAKAAQKSGGVSMPKLNASVLAMPVAKTLVMGKLRGII